MLDKVSALQLAREQIRSFDDYISLALRDNDQFSYRIFKERKRGYLYCLRDLGLIDDSSYESGVIPRNSENHN